MSRPCWWLAPALHSPCPLRLPGWPGHPSLPGAPGRKARGRGPFCWGAGPSILTLTRALPTGLPLTTASSCSRKQLLGGFPGQVGRGPWGAQSRTSRLEGHPLPPNIISGHPCPHPAEECTKHPLVPLQPTAPPDCMLQERNPSPVTPGWEGTAKARSAQLLGGGLLSCPPP